MVPECLPLSVTSHVTQGGYITDLLCVCSLLCGTETTVGDGNIIILVRSLHKRVTQIKGCCYIPGVMVIEKWVGSSLEKLQQLKLDRKGDR